MKKKLIIPSLLVFAVAIFIYKNVETKPKTTAEKLRNQLTNFRENHPFSKTRALSEEERSKQGLPPNAYFEQEYLNEMNPKTG
ncbi:MAG: hypothetical protein ACWIPI_09430, partial [Polaribacter sp.]